MTGKIVRIGGATAFRADSVMAVPQLLAGAVDYLIFDNLAEGSIGAFGQMAAKDPAGGFATEFAGLYVLPWLAEMLARKVRVITNAGALNPRGCAEAMARAAEALGLKPRIAYVEGDDLRHREQALRAAGHTDMFSGAPFPVRTATSINAYMGAFPIAAALARGADIVITGRVVDSALALGPLIHEFGWGHDDFDLLAAGTVAGTSAGMRHAGDRRHLHRLAGCAGLGEYRLSDRRVPGGRDLHHHQARRHGRAGLRRYGCRADAV